MTRRVIASRAILGEWLGGPVVAGKIPAGFGQVLKLFVASLPVKTTLNGALRRGVCCRGTRHRG